MFQITETYAFLPREAVTRFLLGCTECQRRPRSPSPGRSLTAILPPVPAPVPASLPPAQHLDPPPMQGSKLDPTDTPQAQEPEQTSIHEPLRSSTPECRKSSNSFNSHDVSNVEPKRSSNPLDVANLTSPATPPKKRHHNVLENKVAESPTPVLKKTPESCGSLNGSPPPKKIWSPVEETDDIDTKRRCTGTGNMLMGGEIDYSLPITTTYLKYMRSLGCTDEDALKFEKVSVLHFTPCVILS